MSLGYESIRLHDDLAEEWKDRLLNLEFAVERLFSERREERSKVVFHNL